MDENGTQTWTLYDGGNPIMDFNSSGSLTMRYLWGPTGIIARQTSGGTVAWYLADALGSVRDLINNSGAIIDHIDFSAFGTVLDQSDPSEGDRMMGFAGMEQDAVTGLNLAMYREENPGMGRWTSEDPLAFGGGDENLYRYAANSPARFADPGGEEIPSPGYTYPDYKPIPGYNQPAPFLYPILGPGWNVRELSSAEQEYVDTIIKLTLQALATLYRCRLISEKQFLARTRDIRSLKITGTYTDFKNPFSGGVTSALTIWDKLGPGWHQILYSDFFTRRNATWQALVILFHEGYHSGHLYGGWSPDGPGDPPEQTGQRFAELISMSPCTAQIYQQMRDAKEKLLNASLKAF
jgi:RHS repeat-associated protein